MNTEKLAKAMQELKASFNTVIIIDLPIIEKKIVNRTVMVDDPKTVKEWLTKTNYHPDRAVIVSVSKEYQPFYTPGQVVYIDGTRRKNFTPILHDKEVYFRVSIGDVLCVVENSVASEINFEKDEAIIITN
jgi:hypothetical protein